MDAVIEKIRKLAAIMNIDKQQPVAKDSSLKVGVDLGTSSIVLVVLDQDDEPLFGAFEYANAVRDGLVVNFRESVEVVRRLKERAQTCLQTELTHAACAVPPGTVGNNKKVVAHVIESLGMEAVAVVDEPTAASSVLNITDGAVVDVGGGTTGISVFKNGEVIYTADEPTGGTHMTLVLAGYYGITFEEAELKKRQQDQLSINFGIMKPTVEKMAEITRKYLEITPSESLYLVGGATTGKEFSAIFTEYLNLPVFHPPSPELVTPYGIAMNA